MNEKITQLVKEILAEYNLKVEDEVVVEIKQTEDDAFQIIINGTLKNEFKTWCEKLDDDIFVEACERFEDETGISLQRMEENLDTELFKQVVAKICKERINKLSQFI